MTRPKGEKANDTDFCSVRNIDLLPPNPNG